MMHFLVDLKDDLVVFCKYMIKTTIYLFSNLTISPKCMRYDFWNNFNVIWLWFV